MVRYIIGCSGWSYPWWKETFYPKGLRQAEQLSYYSEHFPTVEVNMTFYRFPTPRSIDSWRTGTPDRFVFAAKMNRRITHYRKLHKVDDLVASFITTLDGLGEKLGPILVQLPPGLPPDLELLERFLSVLPSRSYAVEFRDRDWLQPATYRLLESYNIAVAMIDPPLVEHVPATADFAYVRWHGRSDLDYEYGRKELKEWVTRLDSLPVDHIYGYFNNDQGGAAPRDAAVLTGLISMREEQVVR